MSSRARLLASAIVYGLLVFLGTAGLGFAVLPAVGRVVGIDKDAEAALSFLTLKAVPLLVGLSAAATLSYDRLARLSLRGRAAAYAATTLLVWLTGAAVAAFLLG